MQTRNPIRQARWSLLLAAATALSSATVAAAQSRPARAARQGAQAGGGAAGGLAVVRDVLKQVSLTDAQQQKIDGILADAQKDLRDSAQALRDASPEERRDAAREMAKKVADAKAKVEAELTPEQQPKFAHAMAAAVVDRASANVKAATTAAAAIDLTDDEKAKFKAAADAATQSLVGMADAVTAVKDDAGADDVQKQVTQTQQTFRRGVAEALGREKATQLMREAVRQGQGGGRATGRRATSRPAD